MEKDDELKGKGNSYDFGARMLDPRVGRFLSLDPLQKKFSYLSPYIYANNNPIANIDVDGKYALFIHYMLTRYKLMKAGHSEVVANLIAHYTSTYTDNPASRSTSNYGGIVGRSIVAKNVSDSQKNNSTFASIGGALTSEQAKNILYKKQINYDRTKDSQSENAESQLLHATRTYAESEFVSAEVAINRSLGSAWDFLFESAILSPIEKMEENTVAVENLGMALHTFQDVQAHQGAVFRSSVWNFWGLFSTHGNEHDLGNDINPSMGGFNEAALATESAILVHQVLNGNYSGIQNNQRIYMDGMSKAQLNKFEKALNKGGYNMIHIGRRHVKKIEKIENE
jgi:RHS repeat-associated protein